MKKLKFLLLFCFLNAFSQQASVEYTFPKIKSGVNMPVRIPLSEISNMVNASLKDLIFEDNSYTDNDNDQFKVKVWKTKPIRLIGSSNQSLIIEVPLKIWAEKGIGTLGLYTYQNTTFETVMYFSTAVTFNNNWTLTAKTSSKGYKWITKPVLDYGTIKIPITSLVEKSLSEQQSKFCKTIDDQINSQLNFQQYAVTAWNIFSQPFHISEEYNTWLKVSPVAVQITPLKFYSDAVDTNIGIDVYSETYTGQKPSASSAVTTVNNFSFTKDIPNNFLLQTTANIPYTEATRLAQNMFLNKEFDFREGKSKIKITDIKVYRDDERILIEATTEGAINGTSYISGVPVYNSEQRKIVLSDTKFKLKTGNILHKTLSALFKGKIIKTIEQEYGIPTQELEENAKKSIEETFNKNYYKGLKMLGKVYALNPSKILVTDMGITAVIDTNASLRLIVKDL